MGNSADVITNPLGGICLMGGSSEDVNAMKWFLERANGGDILVLRASGSDGYNAYFYSDMGIAVNSVETIVFNNATAANNSYVQQKIEQTEAIWFAGGDQWDYISYWRDTPIDSLINIAITERNIVIGGTSAGMAIQGKYYFSAENGTITSNNALANPFNNSMTVSDIPFLENEYLSNVITDTHFDNPDRKGRLITFLARIYTDYGVFGKAIACDEYTAICIDTEGIARVFAGYPTYDEKAYFVQTNCDLFTQAPETCSPGVPLTWNLGGEALKVYKIFGTATGSNSFDLNNWNTSTGGEWLQWSANAGSFIEEESDAIICSSVATEDVLETIKINIYPNPTSEKIYISSEQIDLRQCEFTLQNSLGQQVPVVANYLSDRRSEINVIHIERGFYALNITLNNSQRLIRTFVKQ